MAGSSIFRERSLLGSHLDGLPTSSSSEQEEVERSVDPLFQKYASDLELDLDESFLCRDKHEKFLLRGLKRLSEAYECLDASRPWLCYWILHSLALLEALPTLDDDRLRDVVDFLRRCQHPEGGFCGGPGQVPHLAPTYAAVNALCTIGTDEALSVINRQTLADFIRKMRDPETGGFKLEETGETDVRGAYCAASVAHLTQIMTKDMFDGTGEWVLSCQTYEGGFAGCPGMEAHGGYSFCAFAALVLLGKEKLCDLSAFTRWIANRQMRYEGGFQGRTNKLVDGCYSFWQGGAFPLIHATLTQEGDDAINMNSWLFDQYALQEYVLMCCQHPGGGLIDKPGKNRDYYHTCYCLSGLSVAQNNISNSRAVGSTSDVLPCTHPLYNVCFQGVRRAERFFSTFKLSSSSSSPVASTDSPHTFSTETSLSNNS